MPDHPNLVFVFADQWRRQAVGCMGADPVETPRLDELATAGTVFENACCNSPLCTPSRASILTGMHPYALGMMHNWLQLPTDAPTVAKTAREAGYDTGYVGKWHLDEWDGDESIGDAWSPYTPPGEKRQGFEFWYAHGCNHDHFERNYMDTGGEIHEESGWQVDHETDVAIDYVENSDGQRDGDDPFCLYVSYSPPHGPFEAPAEYEEIYRGRELPARPNANRALYRGAAPGYFGAVTSIDENVGRLLDALDREGLAEETIVVVTADHGEMLGSHGAFSKDVWFEESLGVPLLVRYPGTVPAGRRVEQPVGLVDLAPTLLSMMGCDVSPEMHGSDDADLFAGATGVETGPVFFSHASGAPPPEQTRWPDVFPEEENRQFRGVRTERFTYVAFATEYYASAANYAHPMPGDAKRVLYDNANDPWQTCPVFPEHDPMDKARPGLGGLDPEPPAYAAVADRLHDRMADWLDELGDPFLEEQWV